MGRFQLCLVDANNSQEVALHDPGLVMGVSYQRLGIANIGVNVPIRVGHATEVETGEVLEGHLFAAIAAFAKAFIAFVSLSSDQKLRDEGQGSFVQHLLSERRVTAKLRR